MAGIDDLIAQGPGRRDFSPLGELFGAYREGVKGRREDELAQARRSLGPFVGPDGRPDFGAASLHLLRGGDIAGATALARLAWGTGARRAAPAQPYAQAAGADTSSAENETDPHAYEPVTFADNAPAARAPMTAQPHFALPNLRRRDEVEDALAQARAARAEGRDPGLILKRLRDLGIGVSNY